MPAAGDLRLLPRSGWQCSSQRDDVSRFRPEQRPHPSCTFHCREAKDQPPHLFAGQNVGVKEVSAKVWLVSFMKYDLGFFDQELGTVTSAENPFGAKVLPMCSAV